jgi:hypothetical protein
MRLLFVGLVAFSAIGLGAALAGSAEPGAVLISRLYGPDRDSPYTPIPDRKGTKLASGEECPSQSSSYCPNDFPVCCLVSGEYGCYAKREDCKEK